MADDLQEGLTELLKIADEMTLAMRAELELTTDEHGWKQSTAAMRQDALAMVKTLVDSVRERRHQVVTGVGKKAVGRRSIFGQRGQESARSCCSPPSRQ